MALGSHSRCSEVKTFRTQVSVPTKHLPIFMPRDERNLLNLKSCLEEPTGALVAQVVEVQIDNTQVLARAGEGGAC